MGGCSSYRRRRSGIRPMQRWSSRLCTQIRATAIDSSKRRCCLFGERAWPVDFRVGAKFSTWRSIRAHFEPQHRRRYCQRCTRCSNSPSSLTWKKASAGTPYCTPNNSGVVSREAGSKLSWTNPPARQRLARNLDPPRLLLSRIPSANHPLGLRTSSCVAAPTRHLLSSSGEAAT